MEDFSLIRQLDKKNDAEPSPMAEGVSYQQYELEVDGKVQIVNIPLKEIEAFEDSVVKIDGTLTRKVLKHILREHRGVRG